MKTILIVCALLITQNACTKKNYEYSRVENENSSYTEDDIFNKIANIPYVTNKYTIESITDFCCDLSGNIYVLAGKQGKVFKFDSNGVYIEEFYYKMAFKNAKNIFVHNDKLYIYLQHDTILMMTKDGENLENYVLDSNNYITFCSTINGVAVLYHNPLGRDRIDREYKLVIYDNNFERKKDILTYNYNKIEDIFFNTQFIIAINENEDYIFADERNSYRIVMGNADDRSRKIISKTGDIEGYSDAAIQYLMKRFKRQLDLLKVSKIPEKPPVIRKLFIGNNGYIFAMVGIINEDTGEKDYYNMDIFDLNGRLVQSTKVPPTVINRRSVYDKGLLMTVARNEDNVKMLRIFKPAIGN